MLNNKFDLKNFLTNYSFLILLVAGFISSYLGVIFMPISFLFLFFVFAIFSYLIRNFLHGKRLKNFFALALGVLLGIFLTSVFLYPASSQNNLSYFLFIEIKNLLVIFVFLFFTGLLLEIVSNSKLFSILSNKEIESISSNAKIKLIYKIIISFLLSILLIRKIVCGFFISKIELCENLNFCYFICYLYYYFSKIILFIFITIYLISPLLRLRIKFLTFYQFLAFIISIWTFSFPFWSFSGAEEPEMIFFLLAIHFILWLLIGIFGISAFTSYKTELTNILFTFSLIFWLFSLFTTFSLPLFTILEYLLRYRW